MAGGSLERPARSRSSWFTLGILALSVACAFRRQEGPLVRAEDRNLTQRQGVLSYFHRPFSGALYRRDPNGDTLSVSPYRNGKADGVWRIYHPNGHLSEVRYYEDGQKEGTHRGWYPNGVRRVVYHFKHDAYEGEFEQWLEDGRRYKRMNYRDGQEDGLQQAWKTDGVLYANYVVKDGKRYGLAGSANCVNVKDDLPPSR